MNRSIIKYLLVFVAVGAVVFFLLKDRNPFGKSNSSFGADTEKEITRIDLLQGEKKLSLEKKGEIWLFNKKEEARKSAVLFIIRTLREIKIKSPVSDEMFENEIVKKEINPVRVTVYSGKRIIKSFYVYKTGSNSYGNIMKMKVSSKPFIVHMPGFEENIGSHFVVNELFWKPYIVFNLLPSQISSVKFENLADTSSSFIINCSGGTYSLSDMKNKITGWDTSKVKRYITYYTSIRIESWAFELSEEEKRVIESEPPVYRISVKPQKGDEIILTIREKWITEEGKKTPDTDRAWAKTNSSDEISVMRYLDLDPIIKKRSYFFAQ